MRGFTQILFGFPGVGKTYAADHQEELNLDIEDSDSMKFHWLYDDDGNFVMDAFGNRAVHPEWPQNYANYIRMLIDEAPNPPDVILVSTHEEVMKAVLNTIADENTVFWAMVPHPSLKDRFLKLYRDRASTQQFIDQMNYYWGDYIKSVNDIAEADELGRCFVLEIRDGGRFQNVYDFLKDGDCIQNPLEKIPEEK